MCYDVTIRPDRYHITELQPMALNHHVLLTALGMHARDTTYELSGHTATACLAPLALVKLLDFDVRPDRVIALVTAGAAKTTWPAFTQAIRSELGFDAQRVDIPDGVDGKEIGCILGRCATALKDAKHVTLDVTQGLRHFPFIMYALGIYLQTLRNVRIEAVYYGVLELPGAVKKIIDLRPLLTLPNWFYATRTFRDTGSTRAMADLVTAVAQDAGQLARRSGNDPALCRRASETRRLARHLQGVSFAYESGMPLELGKQSALLAERLAADELLRIFVESTPLAGEIAAMVATTARVLALTGRSPKKGDWKKKIRLGSDELEREARLIEHYLDRSQLPLAIGLMQEWVVSWVIVQRHGAADWLKYNPDRRRAAGQLGALSAYAANRERAAALTDLQLEWATFWNQLTDLRNTLHHHGMRTSAIESAPDKLGAIVEFWQRIRRGTVTLPTLGGGSGHLLITPVGNRYGVLYSAFCNTMPDSCLAICSPQSRDGVELSVRRAGFSGPVHVLVVQDPHAGFKELPPLVDAASAQLLAADQISANLTGGTTLMGIAVQQLVERARRLARPTRRLVLIDRRPVAEQDEQPFTVSSFAWLDPEP